MIFKDGIITEADLKFIDYSTLIEFKKCPRRYYFRHVKKLVPDTPALALSFGASWGSAMDGLYAAISTGERDKSTLMKIGLGAFIKRWTEDGLPAEILPVDSEAYGMRQPMTAMNMLINYIDKKMNWLGNVELIGIEVPFAVPIDPERPDRFYIGRIDKVIKDVQGRIKGIEHKTSSLYSTKHGIQPAWDDTFDPNSQIDGYIHALSIMYKEESGGVEVDGALVHKNHHDIFKVIPFSKMQVYTNEFLRETTYWWNRLEDSHEENFFPKNDWSCVDRYGTCPYLGLCRMTPRLDRMPEGVPVGYKITNWQPYDTDTIRAALANTHSGMHPEEAL